MNSKLQHYYLVSVTILFMDNQNMVSYPMNVMLVTDEPKVTRKNLAIIQQQAQVNLFGKFPELTKTGVNDVIIGTISHLGEMTHEEFHAGFPEATPAAEKPKPLDEVLRDENEKARSSGQPEPYMVDERATGSTEDEKSNG